MSDTLQEEEDRLPLVSKNHSEGECSEPDCPCHEWVKRVDRHDNSERTAGRCPHCGARIQSDFDPDVGMWYECSECDYREAVSSTSEHQPAARGGGPKAGEALAQYRRAVIEREYPALVTERETLRNFLRDALHYSDHAVSCPALNWTKPISRR